MRVMPLSTRALMGLLGVFRKERHKDGYLAEDDVVIEKAFARKLSWAGWTYSFAKERKVYGLHIVVVLWCSFDGRLGILVAFRLWRPRRSCAPHLDRTKLKSWRRSCSSRSSVRGCAPNTASSTLITTPDGLPRSWEDWSFWVGTLHPRTIILWRGQRRSVAELSQGLPLKWRKRLGMRAASGSVYAPKYGSLRLVVPRNLSGQLRAHRHQRLGSRPYKRGEAQDEPLVRRDALSRP
ncbi:MAG: hypothetical protein M3334_02185 [Actinomycetota bacterium]|nr:hypothetical protein [Actinomycetota bacterium]